MKLTMLIILINLTGLYANVMSQEMRLNIKMSHASLDEVLTQIEKQSQYRFFYQNELLSKMSDVDLNLEGATLSDVMQIFEQKGISYKIYDKNLVVLASASMLKQAVKVAGRVTDAVTKMPLPGVNITVSGTTRGVVTDADGHYSLELPDAGSTLVFSFIGYVTQEFVPDGKSELNVEMVADVKALEEVIVVGYGTQKKSDITASISSIKGEQIASGPAASFNESLQGKTSGLQVSQTSGALGSATRIIVRGTGSISSGTNPLYIVDGMPIYQDVNQNVIQNLNPFQDINPKDIESIEVLKDASATAIYGSRGANGVILITTKTGKKGEGKISFDYNYGVTTPINTVELANGAEWLATVDEARTNSGITDKEFTKPLLFDPNQPFNRTVADKTNTDWYGMLIDKGNYSEYNFSASKGSNGASYYISAQYRDEKGLFTGNRMRRYQTRANLDFKPLDKVTTGLKLNFTRIDLDDVNYGIGNGANDNGDSRGNRGGQGGYGQIYRGALPIFPFRNDDGTIFDPKSGKNVAWAAQRNNLSITSQQYRTFGTAYIEYNPLPGLTLRTEGSIDQLSYNSLTWIDGNIRMASRNNYSSSSSAASDSYRGVTSTNFNAVANYNKTFNNNHNIAVTLGTESLKTFTKTREYFFGNIQGQQQEIGEGGDRLTAVTNQIPDIFFLSYFGRFNYKYKDRYLLGMSYRRDGSSVFSPDERFGNFPALSAGWIVSNEKFMNTFPLISHLKLRGSYGSTGNANINAFAWSNQYVQWPIYGLARGSVLNNLGTRSLTWERSKTFDASIDFGLLGNRITGSFGYYQSLTTDMLLSVPVSPSLGIFNFGTNGAAITNIGNLANKGFEVEFTTVNVNTTKIKWTTSFSLTTNHNEVKKLADGIKIPTQIAHSSGVNSVWAGRPLGEFFLAEFAGYDDQGYEMIYEIDQQLFTSSNRSITQKTGNLIRATTVNINANRIYQRDKTGLPTYFGGLTNTFNYGGLELGILFTYQGGNYIYDADSETTMYVNGGTNVIRKDMIGDYWTPSNTGASNPRPLWKNSDGTNTMGTRTTRHLHKGDYIRLKSLTLAYNLPEKLTSKLRIKNARIYGGVTNLLTFSKFKAFDPETAVFKTSNISSTQDINLGQGIIGTVPFPQVRTINGGISFTF